MTLASSARGTIGIIGLGLVGRALAQRLQSAGFHCIGFDLHDEAVDEFSKAGHAVAADVAEIARITRCIVLAVFDTAGVLQIAEGKDARLSLPASARLC